MSRESPRRSWVRRALPMVAAVAALLFLFAGRAGQGDRPQPTVGEAAPSLSVERLLNAPDGASAEWEDLKGKVVVVEFWATWCVPCINQIPHLNELAEEFADEEVVFISLTDEPAATVEPFLKERPIAGWVGLETNSEARGSWGVTAIPRTFIVGRDGRILARGHPMDLDADHIRRALAGEAMLAVLRRPGAEALVAASEPGRLPEAPEALAEGEAAVQLTVVPPELRRTREPLWTLEGEDGRETRLAVPLEQLMREHGLAVQRTRQSDGLEAVWLDVAVNPGPDDETDELIGRALRQAFADPSTSREGLAYPGYTLDLGPDFKREPEASDGTFVMERNRRADGREVIVMDVSMGIPVVASELRSTLNLPVIYGNPTSVGGRTRLTWVVGDLDSAREAVESLGLRLTPESRHLPPLVEPGELSWPYSPGKQ